MIDLKKLTGEKERLTNILSGEVIITPKYFGNSITAEYTKENYSYLKKNKEPITIIDILISDLYIKPMEYLKSVKDCFNEGTYGFINNYKTGKIILDARDYYEPNKFPKDDTFVAAQKLYEGRLDSEQIGMFRKGHINKIFKEFNVSSDITTIFVRSKDNLKEAFKIDTKNQPKIHIPSDMYNLMMVDIIRSVDVGSLKKMMIESDKWEQIYISIINKIFLKYINESKYNISSIDFGYPKYMKVDPETKIEWLSPDIKEHIELYDLYVMLLTSFRKKEQKGNIHMTDKINEKYKEIHNIITSLCENIGINVSIPSYFEHSINK